jgi:16S rRNA (cytosine1402-N4)-methyltransferase
MSNYHTPVLLHACIDNLNINPNGVYVDLTFGGGGHSKEILSNLGATGKLFAFDQDADAQQNAIDDQRFKLLPYNFRYLKNYLRLNGIIKVDGILGDLGVSSHQFNEASRGFSIRFDSELINTYDEKRLTQLFKLYGEIDNAFKLTQLIVKARALKRIETTNELKEVIKSCTPKFEDHKYLAKVFQALRLEVNQELNALEECLSQCSDLLKPNGRLVIISYHSLEDRLVKNIIKTGNTSGVEEKDIIYGTVKKVYRNLTTKPILPSDEEIKINTRARSAKLRVAEKV